MQDRARQLQRADRYAFYVTVKDLGKYTMEGSLEGRGLRDFRAWRDSDSAAWFFVDSVDEGKLNDIEFSEVSRIVARAIEGAERRARIILSCRFTDWDSKRDLETFEELLPSQDSEMAVAPTSEDLLGVILRNEKLPAPPTKIAASVLMMSPLDEARVREYATFKGAQEVDNFIDAIEAGNLWRFARRPLDLEWMVEYWRGSSKLGNLAELLDASLSARVKESNTAHKRNDTLSSDRCRKALERVGAALIFTGAETVWIPSDEVSLDTHLDAIDLTSVLPDWSTHDVGRLLRRPAFDPATYRRSRLHNDNQGEVRSFLAARWLHRMSNAESGDPISIRHLLFDTVYENDVIRPGMELTAAWLALWDDEVARQIIARDPTLLMNQGDPGSLSLPTRARVLDAWVGNLVIDQENSFHFDHDKLRRFVTPSLADQIRNLWLAHREKPAVPELLVMMIWLGRLDVCLDIALEAALDTSGAFVEKVFAGRAVAAMGDLEAKLRLAEHIRANRSTLAPGVVWDAVENLFPTYLSVVDLLSVVDTVGDADTYGLRYVGAALAEKLISVEELRRFNEGLLDRAKKRVPSAHAVGRDEAYEVYGAALVGSALKLLKYCSDDEVSLQSIDTYLWIYRDPYVTRRREGAETALKDELGRTSTRRRAFFWRTAERLNGSPAFANQPLTDNYQLQVCGWPGGLQLTDVDWLLRDMTDRISLDDRKLCLSSVHLVWQSDKTNTHLIARIEQTAQADPDLAVILQAWMGPHTEDPQRRNLRVQMETQKLKHQSERAATEESWRSYIAQLQEQAEELRCLPPPKADSVDRRLYSLWRLASPVCAKNNCYSFNSLKAIEPLLGRTLTDALFTALINFWRNWSPTMRTSREPSKQNVISELDCIGIAGISLESVSAKAWPARLSDQEASLATQFATIELNGFPPWLNKLAATHADAVSTVLVGEVCKELDEFPENPHSVGVLDRLSHSDRPVRAAVASRLLLELNQRSALHGARLEKILEVIVDNLSVKGAQELTTLALQRADVASDSQLAAAYLDAAFLLAPRAAIETLTQWLDRTSPEEQTRLASALLPRLFGDRMLRSGRLKRDLPFGVLKRLALLAFKTIRIEDDIERPSNQVYTPGEQDHAQAARSAVFGRLIETPGRATYATLLEMASTAEFPIPPRRLREFALQRAIKDARFDAWHPADVVEFETSCEHAPTTALELQGLLGRRIRSFEYELLNGDFKQAKTLKRLENETLVQNWVAEHLRSVQKSSYGVDRETERADEKRPDIVIRAKASDANLAIEIKVADDLSVEQLEEALSDQLCKKYLRATGGRYGILLIVHQKRRAQGWRHPSTQNFIQFDELIEHLRVKAREKAAQPEDSPQPTVEKIDASSVAD